MSLQEEAEKLNETLATLSLNERLAHVASLGKRVVFTTSLGIEDQVITHAIAASARTIKVATLETGRLFQDTLDLISITEELYDITIAQFKPVKADIDAYAAQWAY